MRFRREKQEMALAAKNLGRIFRNTGKAREQIFSICKTLTIYIYTHTTKEEEEEQEQVLRCVVLWLTDWRVVLLGNEE